MAKAGQHFIRYRNRAKIQRALVIGEAQEIRLQRAYELASDKAKLIKSGIDIAESTIVERNAETLSDVWQRYHNRYAKLNQGLQLTISVIEL